MRCLNLCGISKIVMDNAAELARWRQQIDELDQSVLALINQRAELAHKIGQLKTGTLYRPEREAQVLTHIRHTNPGPLSDETVTFLFREIMSACLAFERPITVGYLGPVGTYSQEAALRHFGCSARFDALPTLDKVFESCVQRVVDFIIVPVENSTEGAVNRTLDLLLTSPLKICGEYYLKIQHQLWALPTVQGLSSIQRVYAHSQPFGQCQRWLQQYLPNAETYAVSSNAEAARLVSEGPPTWAAIGGPLLGENYPLTSLALHLEDEPNNTTRFLILGPESAGVSGQDKTSLILATPNKPGAIHQLLTPFAQQGVSLTRLESRPAKTSLWEYVFYLDIQGHSQDPELALALKAVQEQALFYKLLGSYPVAKI